MLELTKISNFFIVVLALANSTVWSTNKTAVTIGVKNAFAKLSRKLGGSVVAIVDND